MISRSWLPIAIFLGGVACISAAVATGGAEVDLVLIFPVFSGSSGLFLAGVGLIVLSFMVGFFIIATSGTEVLGETDKVVQRPAAERKSSYGGVVLIGPIPIAFGSDKKMAVLMLILGLATAVILIGLLLMSS